MAEAGNNLILDNKAGSACFSSVLPLVGLEVSFFTSSLDGSEVLTSKLERYSGHHRRALDMAKFMENIAPDRAENLRTCGAFLQFHDYYTLGELRLIAAKFCSQDRLCPFCACRRAGKFLRKYVEKVRRMLVECPEWKGYLVTVTVLDGGDLRERVGHLLESWRALVQKRRDYFKVSRHRRPFTEFARAEGAVSSVEVKRGKFSDLWHPHLHSAWLVSDSLPLEVIQGKLRYPALESEWSAVTGDSFIVHAKPFDASTVGGDFEQVAGDFAEVFKYALKFGDMSLEDNYEAWRVLFGERLVESFGCFRGIVTAEDLKDDMLAADLPYVEVIARFMARSMSYEVTHETEMKQGRMGALERLRRIERTRAGLTPDW